MNITMAIYIAILFILLTPGQFITLPSDKSDKFTITLVHAVIFAFIWQVTNEKIKNSKTQITL